jgi:hypothetical protein
MKASVFFVIALCVVRFANAQVIMEPTDRPVTLAGTNREIHGYGPPGFGENKKADAPVNYLVIDLPRPINIPCIPERPLWKSTDCGAARRLKLFFSTGNRDELELTAKNMKGRRVGLTGTLKRQATAGEMTPIYFEVTAIQATPNGS